MPSSPDTLAEAKENFWKKHEAYKRRGDGDNLHKHPVPKWTPRPGSRVLIEGRTTPGMKDIPAVVLSISLSDRSCRVQHDSDNCTFLLNRSKLVRDPSFSDARTTPGVTPGGPVGGDVVSPRSAIRGRVDLSPVRGVRRQLRFLGVQPIPDEADTLPPVPGGEDAHGGDSSVGASGAPQLPEAPEHMKKAHLLAPGPTSVEDGFVRKFMLLLDGMSFGGQNTSERERVYPCNA